MWMTDGIIKVVVMLQEEMWRNLINGLPGLPDDGSSAPSLESIKEPPIHDGETPVLLQKIITEIYVYTSLDQDNLFYGTKSFEDVQILGEFRLSEAHTIINTAKKKKRRR